MDLELSHEQEDLRDVAEQMLERTSPLSLARSYLTGDGDAGDLHRELGNLSWYSVGLEVDDPFGVTGLSLLAEQCGRHVTPNVLVDTAVAARLAAALPERDEPVRRLAEGEATCALAVLEQGSGWMSTNFDVTLSESGNLSGAKLAVQHAGAVEMLAVVVNAGGQLGVVFVEPGAAGVSIELEDGLDPSSAPCRVIFEDVSVPSERLLLSPVAEDSLRQAFAVGAVATAAEALGAAQGGLAAAIEYALERKQFGRPIGSFQGLQHLIAERHVMRETAWASVLYASATLDEDLPDAEQAVMVAKAHGSRAARSAIEGALQVFGGIAFTWEHDAHLWQRRVLVCEERFGGPLQYERALGERLSSKTD
jgi:alkylation response protein AidB-like acyl-CoA dehydrogenase